MYQRGTLFRECLADFSKNKISVTSVFAPQLHYLHVRKITHMFKNQKTAHLTDEFAGQPLLTQYNGIYACSKHCQPIFGNRKRNK